MGQCKLAKFARGFWDHRSCCVSSKDQLVNDTFNPTTVCLWLQRYEVMCHNGWIWIEGEECSIQMPSGMISRV